VRVLVAPVQHFQAAAAIACKRSLQSAGRGAGGQARADGRPAAAARRGLHFLVVQKDGDAEECAGLWLMQNRELPSV